MFDKHPVSTPKKKILPGAENDQVVPGGRSNGVVPLPADYGAITGHTAVAFPNSHVTSRRISCAGCRLLRNRGGEIYLGADINAIGARRPSTAEAGIPSQDHVLAAATANHVIPGAHVDKVVTRAAIDDVVVVAADDYIGYVPGGDIDAAALVIPAGLGQKTWQGIIGSAHNVTGGGGGTRPRRHSEIKFHLRGMRSRTVCIFQRGVQAQGRSRHDRVLREQAERRLLLSHGHGNVEAAVGCEGHKVVIAVEQHEAARSAAAKLEVDFLAAGARREGQVGSECLYLALRDMPCLHWCRTRVEAEIVGEGIGTIAGDDGNVLGRLRTQARCISNATVETGS